MMRFLDSDVLIDAARVSCVLLQSDRRYQEIVIEHMVNLEYEEEEAGGSSLLPKM